MNLQANLSSLLKQTSHVGLGLIAVLLLTKGNPSPLVLGGTVVTGMGYVIYAEEKKLTNGEIMTTLSKEFQSRYDQVFKTMDAFPNHHINSLRFLVEDMLEVIRELQAELDSL